MGFAKTQLYATTFQQYFTRKHALKHWYFKLLLIISCQSFYSLHLHQKSHSLFPHFWSTSGSLQFLLSYLLNFLLFFLSSFMGQSHDFLIIQRKDCSIECLNLLSLLISCVCMNVETNYCTVKVNLVIELSYTF